MSITADLSWTGGDPDSGDTVTYDVYFEANDSTPDILICNDASTPVCDPGALAYDTRYHWVVIATDNHGASTTGSTWDFYTATEPGDFPVISNIRESDDPINRESCASDTALPALVTISANVTDSSSAISSVRLYYRSPGGDWTYRTMGDARDRDAYKCTVGPFDQAGTLTYFVWAENDQGNETSTDTYTVTVRDCEIFPTTFAPEQHGLRFINWGAVENCLGMSLTPLDYLGADTDLPTEDNHWIPAPYEEDGNGLQCYVRWRQVLGNWEQRGTIDRKRMEQPNAALRNAQEYEELQQLVASGNPVVLSLQNEWTAWLWGGHAVVVYEIRSFPSDHEHVLLLYDSNNTDLSGVGEGVIYLEETITESGERGLRFSRPYATKYDQLYVLTPPISLIDPNTAWFTSWCDLPSDAERHLQASGYVPQEAYGGTLDSQVSVKEYPYRPSSSAPFAVLLNWAGNPIRLSLYSPDGSLYAERWSDSSPLLLQVPNPDSGTWTIEVEAVGVLYDDCPYVVVIGTKLQNFLPLILRNYGSGMDLPNTRLRRPPTRRSPTMPPTLGRL